MRCNRLAPGQDGTGIGANRRSIVFIGYNHVKKSVRLSCELFNVQRVSLISVYK
jgi:hypothetical protein